MGFALLIARLILGLGLAAHGAQKIFGWFGGYGPAGTGQFFEGLGFRPGVLFAVAAGLGEFVGGLLVAAGFTGGFGPAIMILVMLTAILTVHLTKGFFSASNGWEMPALYIAGALAIDFGGFGVYSLDQAIGWNFFSSNFDRWILVGIAAIVALINYAISKAPKPATSQQPTA